MATLFRYTVILMLSITSSMTSAGADQKVFRLALPPIPILVNDNKQGGIVDLFKEVARRGKFELIIDILPSPRVISAINDTNYTAVAPILNIEIPSLGDIPLELSHPFIFRRDFAFVAEGQEIPRTVADLKGKIVGGIIGYGLDEQVKKDPDIKVQMTKADKFALRMLNSSRIDVLLLDEFTTTGLAEKEGIAIDYDHTSPLFVYPGYLALREKEAKVWLPIINPILEGMWKDGTIKRLIPHNITDNPMRYRFTKQM